MERYLPTIIKGNSAISQMFIIRNISINAIVITIEPKRLDINEMYNVFLRPHFTAGVYNPIFLSAGKSSA
jgi:hypothetical protein